MRERSQLRGHDIEFRHGRWVYCDTGEPTIETCQSRPCGKCGLLRTPEGHDPCLGTLPNVINACCGHGKVGEAYVQFTDGSELRGAAALRFFPAGVLGGWVMTADRILSVLNSHRFPITTEARLQEAMQSVLVDEGFPAEREFRLSAGSRIDLFVRDVGVGIECKIKGGRRDIWRQVERYCEHDQINALILATNVAMALPAEIHGKPAHVLHLARAWM